ncbi:MAG: T9SS type A sorting domain-containing protein [Bacteroidota bacterium]
MKKHLLICTILLSAFTSFGQSRQNILKPASPEATEKLLSIDREGLENNLTKTLLCLDTIRYPQSKEQILGTSNFYTFSMWNVDAEAFSQTFLNAGAGLSVRGAEIFCVRADPAQVGANPTGISIRARLFNVTAGNVPTGAALATGNVTVSNLIGGANANYYTVNFPSPVAVTGNYAIVWDVSTTNGIVDVYVSDLLPGQTYDEDFTRYTSLYYPNSGGAYVSIPTLTNDLVNFPGGGAIPPGPYNFEPLIAPLVQYTITSTGVVAPDPACVNQTLSFTGSATPVNILSNRFYNYGVFKQYFMGAASDSTYAWDFDDASPIAWNLQSTTHAYAAAGAYDPTFYVLGGFWNSCVDFTTDATTINALPAINAGLDVSICNGATTSLGASGGNSYTWSPATSLSSTTISNPIAAPSSTQTYTVSGTSVAGCVNTDQVVVTVNPQVDASFNFATNTFCVGSANPVPSAINSGTYSSTAGLTFVNTTTGEINLAASANGPYVITHTTGGLCPDVETQTINITTAPDASFTFANTAYCLNTANPFPTFGAGASAGVFSSSAGINFVNSTTGQINLATSAPGPYTITNSIAASGACPATSANFIVTLNAQPTVEAGNSQAVCTGTQVTLTGAGANSFTWSNGVVNGAAFTPAVGSISYTVTGTDLNGCTNTDNVVVTVNVLPSVSAGPDDAVCAGTQVTLNGQGAQNYTWTNGVSNGTAFTPSVGSITYTVTGTDINGCINTDNVIITTNALPTVNAGADVTICVPQSTTLFGSGASTYTWSPPTGLDFTTAANPTASPTITTTYTVTGTNTNGCVNSDEVTVIVDCIGLDELGINISVAPNPATETLVILQESSEDLQLSIVSEDGKLVLAPIKLNSISTTFDVSDYASGIYFLHFTNNNGQIVKKLIIQ